MPKHKITLKPQHSGGYLAILTDEHGNFVEFGRCQSMQRDGKRHIIGPSTRGLMGWEFDLWSVGGGLFHARVTDNRDWLIVFNDCEATMDDGQQCIEGWSNDVRVLEPEERKAAA
ncbi:hypothetical protein AmDm5_0501 [Acetobacter malorum]|uniref:Uncharacterized protein n=1 Tax=Acetobacter malorum TaxID=178901 RepID=A0A087PXF7_9PROT|nr:hypothetical protein [Acetobacter malorum]KFL92060.1 hypothetical protein AmDm5_0501 [Acetobacter malorum]OAG78499.1 hypothetical protein Amal_00512 [Acetobacter malorum]